MAKKDQEQDVEFSSIEEANAYYEEHPEEAEALEKHYENTQPMSTAEWVALGSGIGSLVLTFTGFPIWGLVAALVAGVTLILDHFKAFDKIQGIFHKNEELEDPALA